MSRNTKIGIAVGAVVLVLIIGYAIWRRREGYHVPSYIAKNPQLMSEYNLGNMDKRNLTSPPFIRHGLNNRSTKYNIGQFPDDRKYPLKTRWDDPIPLTTFKSPLEAEKTERILQEFEMI